MLNSLVREGATVFLRLKILGEDQTKGLTDLGYSSRTPGGDSGVVVVVNHNM